MKIKFAPVFAVNKEKISNLLLVMKKFLGKLFTLALYVFVIGAIAKAGYDMFGDKDKLKNVMVAVY